MDHTKDSFWDFPDESEPVAPSDADNYYDDMATPHAHTTNLPDFGDNFSISSFSDTVTTATTETSSSTHSQQESRPRLSRDDKQTAKSLLDRFDRNSKLSKWFKAPVDPDKHHATGFVAPCPVLREIS